MNDRLLKFIITTKQSINRFLWYITPRIYNLPQVIRIVWMDREYYLHKYDW